MELREINPSLDDFFTRVYGQRWTSLVAALGEKERQVQRLVGSGNPPICDIDWLAGCRWATSENENAALERNEQNCLKYYVLDPASVLVARALPVQPGDFVLDMCAAPGGKSLILTEALKGEGQIWLNEPSAPRRDRLKKILRQYLPESLRQTVKVSGKDGLKFGMQFPQKFDSILVDAPCSGERHLLKTPSELRAWTEKRTRRLAQKQYGLLASAILSAKSGGSIVYSTCSLSPFENDEVINRVLKKKADLVELDNPSEPPSPLAEKIRCGWVHLPDKCGFGPLYFARMRKL